MKATSSRLFLLPLAAVLGTGCFVDSGTTPTPKDPCDPNPCTQGDKTQCVNEDGNARCLCKSGTVLRPSGVCEPLSAANCPEHTGDSAEPDDCFTRAAALTADNKTRSQSIDPVGDYDFFKVDAKLKEVYGITVEPGTGSLLPRVDVFDQAGVWQTSQDGNPKVQMGFKARATAPYYVRVSHSPYDVSTATGAYTLTFSDLGQDDYGDSAAEATTVTADVAGTTNPTVHAGRFEYGQDQDWFSLAVTQGTTYRIVFDTGLYVPAVAFYTSADTKTPVRTDRNATVDFTAASTTTVYLNLYPHAGAPGSYAFTLLR